MNNYTGDTLKETLQLLGGVVIRSFDLETGEVFEPAGVGLVGSVPLSTAHKSTRKPAKRKEPVTVPFVEWRQGASILKVSKAEPTEQHGGGKRGIVKGFSRGSRSRLMKKIGGVKRDAFLPCFVTLTYPNIFPEPKQSKKLSLIHISEPTRPY